MAVEIERRSRTKWAFVQWAVLGIAVVHLVQAIVGFIAEPSFAIGPDAPTAQILGMDYNGWHAVAGLLLFGPALLFATRKSWSVLYCFAAGVAGGLPGVWALFSHQPAYVFNFPNNIADAIQHFVVAGILIACAVIQIRRDGSFAKSMSDLRG